MAAAEPEPAVDADELEQLRADLRAAQHALGRAQTAETCTRDELAAADQRVQELATEVRILRGELEFQTSFCHSLKESIARVKDLLGALEASAGWRRPPLRRRARRGAAGRAVMGLCPGCGAPVDLETVGVHCMDCDPTGLADLLTKDLHDVKDAVRGLRSAALQVLDLFEGGIYHEAHTKALRELERLARP